MQVSAELRWFWFSRVAAQLEDWFIGEGSYRGGHDWSIDRNVNQREDVYFMDWSHRELGVKQRGGKPGVEIKGLVATVWDRRPVHPFDTPPEIWCKWASPSMPTTGKTLPTLKTRYLRKFEMKEGRPDEIQLGTDEKPLDPSKWPQRGCNVELTRVQVGSNTWWTLGFEAFGGLDTVVADLCAVAAAISDRQPPFPEDGIVESYPDWLQNHANTTSERLPSEKE
jgi:hypothetical protein